MPLGTRGQPPDFRPRKIFHITQVKNLPSIVGAGWLYSDSRCRAGAANPTNIGYSHIKGRRLVRPVPCAARGCLGDYVPFNFCPRSVMLYVVNNGHDDYKGGQEEVVHLCSTVGQGMSTGRAWAFTDRHADVAHALYYDDPAKLDQIPWKVMPETYWQSVKEERQAEFLVHEQFPWTAINEVACMTEAVAERARGIVGAHGPAVSVRREWYY